jgi:hypothetical protein
MKEILLLFAGTTSFLAQIPVDTFLPPGTEQLTLTGASFVAIWWLIRLIDKLTKNAVDRERELKTEYDKRIEKLERQVKSLQQALLNSAGIDLSKTTRRSLIAEEAENEDDV